MTNLFFALSMLFLGAFLVLSVSIQTNLGYNTMTFSGFIVILIDILLVIKIAGSIKKIF